MASKGAVHELVHVLHRNLDDNAFSTGWLYEGVAIYLTDCCHTYAPTELSYLRKGKRPAFARINADPTYRKKYEVGPFIVEFLVQTYGWNQVVRLLRQGGDIERVLEQPPASVEEAFYAYLEKTYFQ